MQQPIDPIREIVIAKPSQTKKRLETQQRNDERYNVDYDMADLKSVMDELKEINSIINVGRFLSLL